MKLAFALTDTAVRSVFKHQVTDRSLESFEAWQVLELVTRRHWPV